MRKRIILVTQSFPYGKGESSFIIPELKLLQEEYDVTIIARNVDAMQTTIVDDSIDLFRYNASLGIGYFLLHFYYMVKREIIVEIIHNAFNFKKQLKLFKFVVRGRHFANYARTIRNSYNQEALYYCYWNDYAAYGVACLSKKNGDKSISRIHGGDLYCLPVNLNYQPLKRFMAEKLDRIIFISQAGMDYFINKYEVKNRNNLKLYRMGVNNYEGRNKKSQDEVLRLLSISNIIKDKRIDLLILALSEIRNINIKWTHIGDGDYRDIIVNLAKEKLSSKENISYSFLGQITNDQVRNFYENEPIDLFISTSLSEGLPVSMMEAASYGVPIIGTNVGGVSEIVKNRNGFLLDKNFDIKTLSSTIERFYFMEEQMKINMRNESRMIWETNFSADINYAKLLKEVKSLWE